MEPHELVDLLLSYNDEMMWEHYSLILLLCEFIVEKELQSELKEFLDYHVEEYHADISEVESEDNYDSPYYDDIPSDDPGFDPRFLI